MVWIKEEKPHFTGTYLRVVYEIHFRKSRVDNRALFVVSANIDRRLMGNAIVTFTFFTVAVNE